MTAASTFRLAFSRRLNFRGRLLWRIYEDWCRGSGLSFATEDNPEETHDAVLAHLLDSLCKSDERVQQFGDDGMLIFPSRPSVADECLEWQAIQKPPLVYARLVASVASEFEVQVALGDFVDLSSYLTPLDACKRPLLTGAPIQLLPWNIPAFYLNDYKGTTEALSTLNLQFLSALPSGCSFRSEQFVLACLLLPEPHSSGSQALHQTIVLTYPRSLCLLVDHPSRTHLANNEIPQLPDQLQASPAAFPAVPKAKSETCSGTHPVGSSLLPVPATFVTSPLDAATEEVSSFVQFLVKERERLRTASAPHSSPGRSHSLLNTIQPMSKPDAGFTAGPSSFYPSPETSSPFQATPGPMIREFSPSISIPNAPSSIVRHENPFFNEEWLGIDLDFTQLNPSILPENTANPFSHSHTSTSFDTPAASTSPYVVSAGTTGPFPPVIAHNAPQDDFTLTDDDFSFFDAPPSAAGSTFMAAPTSSNPFAAAGLAVDAVMPDFALPASDPTMTIDWASTFTVTAPLMGPEVSTVGLPTPRTPEKDCASLPTPDPRNTVNVIAPALPEPLGNDPFQAIVFSHEQRERDLKYSSGKFGGDLGLPSPPSSPQRSVQPSSDHTLSPSIGGPFSHSSDIRSSWQSAYDSRTDPRIRMVKFLKSQSAKKKSLQLAGLPWTQEGEEWRVIIDYEMEDDDSSSSSSDEEDTASGSVTPLSPLPSYLPPGPSLISTRFRYENLQSFLSSSAPTPVGIPTPISPARMTRGEFISDRQSRRDRGLLEKWANLVAREVDSFEAVVPDQTEEISILRDFDMHWLQSTLESSLNWTAVACSSSEQLVQHPSAYSCLRALSASPVLLSVPRQNALMTIGPSSLRFWDKLGLGPRWGRKDVRVCVAWVNAGDQSLVDPRIHDWLTALRAEWERSSFGTMKFVSTCPDNGVWSCTSDGLQDVVDGLRAAQSSESEDWEVQCPVLLLIALPDTLLDSVYNPASPLIDLIRNTMRANLNFSPKIILHLMSQSNTIRPSSLNCSFLRGLSMLLYDKIPFVVKRRTSGRRVYQNGVLGNQKDVMAYSVTLAPVVEKWHARFDRNERASLGVGTKSKWICVGYSVISLHASLDAERAEISRPRFLVASIVDSLGEKSDVFVSLCPSALEEARGEDEASWIVRTLWDWMVSFVKDTDVEWKVSFSRLGPLSLRESQAWTEHLSNAFIATLGFSNIRVWISFTEETSIWGTSFEDDDTAMDIDPQPAFSKTIDGGLVFAETSSTTYLVDLDRQTMLHAPIIVKETANIISSLAQPFVSPLSFDLTLQDAPALMQITFLHISSPSGSPVNRLQKSSQVKLSLVSVHCHPQTTLPPLQEEDEATEINDLAQTFWALSVLAQARLQFVSGFVQSLDQENSLPLHLSQVKRIGKLLCKLR